MTRALLLTAALCAAASAGASARPGGKRRRVAPSTSAAVQTQMAQVLDGESDHVQQCALDHAVSRGAASVEVGAKLLVNDAGQVMSCEVSVTTARGDRDALRACVERVLRAAPFPRGKTPLVDVERKWSFSVAEVPRTR